MKPIKLTEEQADELRDALNSALDCIESDGASPRDRWPHFLDKQLREFGLDVKSARTSLIESIKSVRQDMRDLGEELTRERLIFAHDSFTSLDRRLERLFRVKKHKNWSWEIGT